MLFKIKISTIICIISFYLISCNQSTKKIALTFDDAPDSSYTEKILDILKKENIKATFFILGYKAQKYPEIIKRINNEGHLIGNHSSYHKNFTEYKDSITLLNDVLFVDSVLYSIIGKKTKFIRPPYGAITNSQKKILQSHAYKIAMWTISAKDWDVFNITKQNIIDTVKKHHQNNAIILLHSKNESVKIEDYPYLYNTLDALPEIIKFLKKEHYKFVTIDKILNETTLQ